MPHVFFIWTAIALPLAIIVLLRLFQYVSECARRRGKALEISDVSELVIPSLKSFRTWWGIMLVRNEDPELERRRRSFLFWFVTWNVGVIVAFVSSNAMGT